MKKILIIAFAVFGYFTKAQQQDLLENTWYLEKLVIGGEEFIPPNNEEVNNVVFEYVEGEYTFHTNVCASIFIGAEFADNDSFWAYSWEENDQYCTDSSNSNFEHRYFYEFWLMGIFEGQDYNYQIAPENEELKLIISTDDPGTKAYYSNQILSTSEVTNSIDFQVAFQNENLIIKNRGSRAESVSIFDLNGKMLLSNSVSSEGVVSTAQLPKGIYIIRLTDEKGNVLSKKLRK